MATGGARELLLELLGVASELLMVNSPWLPCEESPELVGVSWDWLPCEESPEVEELLSPLKAVNLVLLRFRARVFALRVHLLLQWGHQRGLWGATGGFLGRSLGLGCFARHLEICETDSREQFQNQIISNF